MWLLLCHGFVSVVARRDDPNLVLVRARRREHLDHFIARLDPKPELIPSPQADYRWWALLPRADLADLLVGVAEGDGLRSDTSRLRLQPPALTATGACCTTSARLRSLEPCSPHSCTEDTRSARGATMTDMDEFDPLLATAEGFSGYEAAGSTLQALEPYQRLMAHVGATGSPGATR